MTATDGRALTSGERIIVRDMFGDAIDPERVRIHRRKWFFLQPAKVIMAPDGDIWVPPGSGLWADDYARAPIGLQGLFVHEMTHVWQAQRKGRWYLPLMRHPFCRYRYSFVPGWPLDRYGLEQQAEIMRHVFLQRRAVMPPGVTELAKLEKALPFGAA
jgi:hypothetical protein